MERRHQGHRDEELVTSPTSPLLLEISMGLGSDFHWAQIVLLGLLRLGGLVGPRAKAGGSALDNHS